MTAPYGFLTVAGRAAEAAALANGTALEVSHIAWGTGDRAITGGETALQAETGRTLVQASGTTSDKPNVAWFRTILTAESGPIVIREAGLFSPENVLLAIFTFPIVFSKPVGLEITLEVLVGFSDLANLIVRIESSSSFVPAERRVIAGSMIKISAETLEQDITVDLDYSKAPVLSSAAVHLTNDTIAIWDASASAFRVITIDGLSQAIADSENGRLAKRSIKIEGDTAKGMGGGGDISADRKLGLDYSALSALTAADVHLTNDTIAIWDASANAFKVITVDRLSEAIAGATGGKLVPTTRKVEGELGISPGGALTGDLKLKLDLSNLPTMVASDVVPGNDQLALWDQSQTRAVRITVDVLAELMGANPRTSRWQLKSANYTALAGERIAFDVSGGARTLTLPASPTTGDMIVVAAITGDVKTNNLTISGNGKQVQGDTTLVMDVPYATVPLLYNGTAWRIA